MQVVTQLKISGKRGNRVDYRVWIFLAPHESRSGHGAGHRQPVPHRGGKAYMNNPPRLQNSDPIILGAQRYPSLSVPVQSHRKAIRQFRLSGLVVC